MRAHQDIVSEIVLRSFGDFGYHTEGPGHIRAAAEMNLILSEVSLTFTNIDRLELIFMNVVQLEHLPVSLFLYVDSLTSWSRKGLRHRDAGQG